MHFYNELKSSFIIIAFLGYIFLVSGLIINCLQLCSCIIWPFNKELYRKINRYLALGIWSQFTFAAQWWSKSDCALYIKPDDLEKVRKEHAIVIMNHKYDIDWMAGWIICQRLGIMQGSKIVGKQSLKLLPIIGWCWIFTESIFLRRKWDNDRETLVKDLRKILDNYPKNCFFNFLLFCEGTRFTERKRLISMKIAHEKGLPELKHHILPRTKGFTLLLQGSEDRITGIYDLTVGFKKSGAKPRLLSIIEGRSCQAEIFVRRIPLSEIPKDSNGCNNWVYKLYEEKDKIYDYFVHHDTFEGNGLTRVETQRNYYDLLIELSWMIIIGIPSIFYLIKFLWTSSFIAQLIFLIVVILATIGVRAMIAVTEIERGSGLIVNFAQLLTCIFIWPLSKQLYRRINYYLGTLLWSQLTFLYSWWAYSNITVYVDPQDLKHLQHEYAIILVNHRYEIDWLLGLVAAQEIGLLGGLKIVGKRSLSLIPILGWSWFFSESIFLRRIWESDKKVLEHDIQQLLNGYPDNYYFNFLMACEGTRFTERKRLESMKYAREKNLPELKHHILPRTRGFTMIMQGAKGKIPGVYNFMLGFSKDNPSPTFRTLLKGHSCKAQLYIKRTHTPEIPYEDETKCGEWIHKTFQEKDRIYDHFVQHDNFDGLGLPEVPVVRNYSDLLIEIFWLVTIELVEEGDTSTPFYLVMMFILTPLVVSRRVKRSAALVRQKLGTGVRHTMSRSIHGISSTAKRIARMKNFVKKPRTLLKKPKAPSKVSIYKMLPLKLFSRVMGWISRLYLPIWLRPLIFNFYIKIFSCHAHEMYNQDLKSYSTISEFFRRKIKMELRPVDKQSPIVSPCDGRVLTCGKVSRGLIEQVKGITYSASSFLGVPLTAGIMKFQQQNQTRSNYDYDDAHSYAESLLRYRSHALYYAVIYLAPGDYHRFHSPTEWQISWRRHYIGHLFSVNPKVASWLQNLFCLNERAAYYGSWKYGFFSMTAVGATIVGSINVHFDPELKTNNRCRPRLEKTFQTMRNSNGILLKRADNFGDFNFGSTIVLVFEAPDNLVFNFKSGDPIRLGQSLCYLDRQKDVTTQNIKPSNGSPTLSTEESESSNEEDENLNVGNDEQNIDQELLVDTVALDAAIVDAGATANREVISNDNNEQYSSTSKI
ncbi:unnamed protein product [Rotaria sp. Silwood1]|nr:unnamed protein product [Rotaria sp. Silwood1]CAF3427786.1 unnamed protein product [Rotaria sp. Silwood1]CAF3453072.1 unnamed protein product [Rotaria sp. Silwood1]CAF4842745.1 unnamed protein product [Rotaria sp. Silwood1]